jgi:hypothetical protein
MKPEEIFKLALYGTGILAIYKIGTKVGIFQTSEEAAANLQYQSTLEANYWLPKFYKDYLNRYGKIITLTPAAKKTLSDQLWDAKGLFNDDEDKVYAVFRTMNYQTSLSSLADYFLNYKGKDLLSWLKDFLSEEEFKNLSSIISKYKIGYSTDGGKTYK